MKCLARRYYIYKYVYDHEIIYIGKTYRPLSERVYEHAQEKKFLKYLDKALIYWFELDSKIEMDVSEKILINKYKPVLNVVDNDDSVMQHTEFEEPEWKSYAYWDGHLLRVSAKHLFELNVLKKQAIMLQIQDLDRQELLWHHLDDWREFMWNAYIDGWDVGLDRMVRYEWDFATYPLPDAYAVFHSCEYLDYRHTYECYLDYDHAFYLINHLKAILDDKFKLFALQRMDLCERLEKLV